MDVLAEALRVSGARGALGVRLEAGGMWGQWLDSYPGATLHVVSRGALWLHISGEKPLEVQAGDAVLLSPGTAHGIASGSGVTMGPCDQKAAAQAQAHGSVVRLGSSPAQTELITLHYEQDPEVSTPVLTALARPMHVAARENPQLKRTVDLLAAELAQPQIGTTAAVNSIVDLLLVQFVRAWLARHPKEQSGSWLEAIRNPVVRDALACVHREPGRPWTTETLAAAISVSRATLSRHFRTALGQTPGAYVAQWRIDLASVRLRDTDEPVEAISGAVGYGSPHAFSRAFRRARGMAPGEYRSRLRGRASVGP
ncbi:MULTISPECIES: AraC family transcriptional regulator [unclassified Streptomyces]|uniref:AraC family transcriptional regulator n=1 Tax=unclassified Streptomyces TaxID=2593676 RepID=UPI002DD90B0A|nr:MULTISPECIES: AraC family transcriptional regulator [unclassified Streptomyces]WSA90730.1 AraC family transcriptional regulator [Streptomyces sp. NBC_01795]WSS16666.1 AraC family transcriptional regulator [Streptomyces sp. NBC_01186]WSS45484.1 AraC family transcriptional regulator [Streptomyces sp. NBC_01187]